MLELEDCKITHNFFNFFLLAAQTDISDEAAVDALVAQVLRDLLLFFEIDLFLVVVDPGEPLHQDAKILVEDVGFGGAGGGGNGKQ